MLNLSGRAMARTGLRMMPTFPSPSLKFRTVGFPQYGLKASMSGATYLAPWRLSQCPTSPPPHGVCTPPAHVSATDTRLGLRVPTVPWVNVPLHEGRRPSTPGVLGSRPSCVVSRPHRLLRPHPPVPPARDDFAAAPFIRHAFAVRARLGDPRDLPYFCCLTVQTCRRPYTGGFERLSRCACAPLDTRLPRFVPESPPTKARLCQQYPAGSTISMRHRSLYPAARLFASPS